MRGLKDVFNIYPLYYFRQVNFSNGNGFCQSIEFGGTKKSYNTFLEVSRNPKPKKVRKSTLKTLHSSFRSHNFKLTWTKEIDLKLHQTTFFFKANNWIMKTSWNRWLSLPVGFFIIRSARTAALLQSTLGSSGPFYSHFRSVVLWKKMSLEFYIYETEIKKWRGGQTDRSRQDVSYNNNINNNNNNK